MIKDNVDVDSKSLATTNRSGRFWIPRGAGTGGILQHGIRAG